jgi:hypothetical protein
MESVDHSLELMTNPNAPEIQRVRDGIGDAPCSAMTLRPSPRSTPNWANVLRNTLWVSHANTRVRSETLAAVQRSHTLRLEAKWRRFREAEAAKVL